MSKDFASGSSSVCGKDYVEDKYEALVQGAKDDNADKFIDALQRVSKEESLPVSTILDRVNQSGDTLLHVAAKHGNGETVRLICEKFPFLLTQRNSEGNTVWHIASETGNGSLFSILFHLRNDFRNYLSYENHIRVKKDVVWEDLSLRITNKEGNTVLHQALIDRRKDMADALVKQDWIVSYFLNKGRKSALYLAAEAGYLDFLKDFLQDPVKSRHFYQRLKGKSLVHAAIIGRQEDVLAFILNEDVRFIQTTDEEKMNPLHWAASTGFLEGVRQLWDKDSTMASKMDNSGLLPIHWASKNGHINVIQDLLQHCPDPNGLLSRNNRNLLHIAAENGRDNVVSYIIKNPTFANSFINKRDTRGNTPLHLATIHWHPKIVSYLTLDTRVDLKIKNNKGLTALDAAKYNMKGISSFQQWLTWQALKVAGAPSSKILDRMNYASGSPNIDVFKDMISTHLLASIVIAIISFGAVLTTRSGNNNYYPDLGMRTSILRSVKFSVFIYCSTIALYSTIFVGVTLVWAPLNYSYKVLGAFRLAKPFLRMAFAMMFLALVASICLRVSKLHCLVDAVLTAGMALIVTFVTLFFPLCFPLSSTYTISRYIAHCLICLFDLAHWKVTLVILKRS